MDDCRWWQRWNPIALWRLWQYRRSDYHRTQMAGYREGRVCRYCDRNYSEQRVCDLPGRPCDFRVGK